MVIYSVGKKNHMSWLAGYGKNDFCGFPLCVLCQFDRFYGPSCWTGTTQGSGCSSQLQPQRPANLNLKGTCPKWCRASSVFKRWGHPWGFWQPRGRVWQTDSLGWFQMVLSAAACRRCPSSRLSRHQPQHLCPSRGGGRERLELWTTSSSSQAPRLHDRLVEGFEEARAVRGAVPAGGWGGEQKLPVGIGLGSESRVVVWGLLLHEHQRTSRLPAAGVDRLKSQPFSPASTVGRKEEMIKWQELKIR